MYVPGEYLKHYRVIGHSSTLATSSVAEWFDRVCLQKCVKESWPAYSANLFAKSVQRLNPFQSIHFTKPFGRYLAAILIILASKNFLDSLYLEISQDPLLLAP